MINNTNDPLYEEIVQHPLYKEYVHNRYLKPGTVRSYTPKLTIFSSIIDLTPTQQ